MERRVKHALYISLPSRSAVRYIHIPPPSFHVYDTVSPTAQYIPSFA